MQGQMTCWHQMGTQAAGYALQQKENRRLSQRCVALSVGWRCEAFAGATHAMAMHTTSSRSIAICKQIFHLFRIFPPTPNFFFSNFFPFFSFLSFAFFTLQNP